MVPSSSGVAEKVGEDQTEEMEENVAPQAAAPQAAATETHEAPSNPILAKPSSLAAENAPEDRAGCPDPSEPKRRTSATPSEVPDNGEHSETHEISSFVRPVSAVRLVRQRTPARQESQAPMEDAMADSSVGKKSRVKKTTVPIPPSAIPAPAKRNVQEAKQVDVLSNPPAAPTSIRRGSLSTKARCVENKDKEPTRVESGSRDEKQMEESPKMAKLDIEKKAIVPTKPESPPRIAPWLDGTTRKKTGKKNDTQETTPEFPQQAQFVENENREPKRVESGSRDETEIRPASLKRTKLDDGKGTEPQKTKKDCARDAPDPREKPDKKRDTQETTREARKTSANLAKSNPGNPQENVRNTTPNEEKKELLDSTSAKESEEIKPLNTHGRRKPLAGKHWVGYCTMSLLHEEAYVNRLNNHVVDFSVPGADPVPASDSLPSIPTFAFVCWADPGISGGQGLAESERVLRQCPKGCSPKNWGPEEYRRWLQNLFTFVCRRITLRPDNVGNFATVQAQCGADCWGVMPRLTREPEEWTQWKTEHTIYPEKDVINTPPNFVWPEDEKKTAKKKNE